MKSTIQLSLANGKPATGHVVEVKAVGRTAGGRDALLQAPTLASGRTDARGEWRLELDSPPPGKLALVIRDGEGGNLVDVIGPFGADQVTERLDHVLPDAAGRASLPPSPPRKRLSYSEQLRRKTERDTAQSEAIEKALGAHLRQREDESSASRRRARDLLTGTSLRKARRSGRLFVDRGDDPAAAMAEVHKRGVDRMKSVAARRRGATVLADRLPGLAAAAPGTPIEPAAASELARAAAPSGSLMRTASPLQKCQALHRAQELRAQLAADAAGQGASPPADGGSTTAGRSLADALTRIIYGEGGAATDLGTRPDQQSIAGDIAGSQIATGPADSVAYYDYSLLQIAWENVWSTAIDATSEAQLAELYDSIVQLVPGERNQEKLAKELAEIDDVNLLLDTIAQTASVLETAQPIPPDIAAWLPGSEAAWPYLTADDREHVAYLYEAYAALAFNYSLAASMPWNGGNSTLARPAADFLASLDGPEEWLPPAGKSLEEAVDGDWASNKAEAILATAQTAQGARLGRVEEMLEDLKRKIAQPYKFDIFVPDTYNFGIVTTYRQAWTPRNYQPGDLAGTITLAPNEKRTYTVRRKETASTMRRSEDTSSSTSSAQSTETSRIESEISRAVQNKMNARTGTSAGGQFGFKLGLSASADFSGTAEMGFDQASDSAQAKHEIREATRTSAQEYRDERKLEIKSESIREEELTEQREITNPNNELTVTYLFYELQRQYTVAEQLYNVYPVIMVACDVPEPHQVDEAWLLQHGWIIRKVLLDRTLRPTLRLLSKDFAGDELAVEALEEQWRIQINVVAELRKQLQSHVDLRAEARAALERAVRQARNARDEAERDRAEDLVTGAVALVTGGIATFLADELFERIGDRGGSEGDGTVTAENARQALDWADGDLARADSDLREAMNALEVATERYIAAFRQRLDRRVQIDQLILHVKSNILHYMQAIWRHEHPDERYMRLYDLDIQWPGEDGRVVSMKMVPPGSASLAIGPKVPGRMPPTTAGDLIQTGEHVEIKVGAPEFSETRKLHEIAYLDRVVGYMGNYAVFKLRESNALTLFMVQDFLDEEFSLMDPDPFGELPTAEEAFALAECAWNRPETTDADKEAISAWLVEALEAAYRVSQDIVVPTGQLFIEALPGTHPLLEDFKLQHRAFDAQKASAEARMAEVELLRRVARLQGGDLADPDLDRNIRIEGGAVPNVPLESG